MNPDFDTTSPDENDSAQKDTPPASDENTTDSSDSSVEPEKNDTAGSEIPLAPDSTPVVTSPKKPRSKKKIAILVVVLVLIIGGGALWWFVLRDKKATNQPVSSADQQHPAQTTSPVDEALQKFMNPTTGETWLKEPVKLPDQHFFEGATGAVYYEIGSRDGKKIVRADIANISTIIQLYEVSTDGQVAFIAHPDSQAAYPADLTGYLPKSSITVDTTTHYDSLSIPKSLDLGNGYTATRAENTDDNGKSTGGVRPDLGQPPYDGASTEGLAVTTVKTLGQSAILRNEKTYADTQLTGISYGVHLPIGTEVNLEYAPVPLDASGYQWTAGASSVDDTFKAITRGCSTQSGSISRYDAAQATDMEQVGTTSDGQPVYQLKDPANSLLAKAYDEYKQYFSWEEAVSKDEFVNQHALILVKDKTDQWLVYVRYDFAPMAGCAKPVVYLYPQTTQAVDVQVGANVKVSDPLYPAATGWQNVIARPDGQLTYQGKSYDSLFWEGPGLGPYPAITSGTIVKRQDAIATIRQQLAQQGLNAQESANFVAYWQDKLPNKPYVRLTWFNTAQVNRLAPLAITPKPDTVIRVFLDFSGLDAPINLPAQHLTAAARHGFTVVEWGGLSPVKLY